MIVPAYQRTLIWHWLQEVPLTPNVRGEILRTLKKRKDMTHEFPHKTALFRYLVRAGIDPETAERYRDIVWSDYAAYRDAAKHNHSVNPVQWDASAGCYQAKEMRA